jgi:mannose/cellobiose epimerase-like protein (N-acyl-D-glucosamine 2-epimerase family)
MKAVCWECKERQVWNMSLKELNKLSNASWKANGRFVHLCKKHENRLLRGYWLGYLHGRREESARETLARFEPLTGKS